MPKQNPTFTYLNCGTTICMLRQKLISSHKITLLRNHDYNGHAVRDVRNCAYSTERTETPGILSIRYIHFVCITTCAYIQSISFHLAKVRNHERQHLNLGRHIPLIWQINMNKVSLGAFAYSPNTLIMFSMSVRPSVCTHVSARLPPNGFS
jgi:hypothetical protein